MEANSSMNSGPAPLILLNGYPGVGKAAIASALCALIPESRVLDNHMLIDPVGALLERDDEGYRPLRKELRSSVMNYITHSPALRLCTIIATYYQETFSDREIDLEEFYTSANQGGRALIVFILTCSVEENIRRLSSRSSGFKSKLTDVDILKDIRQNHFVYSFYDAGYRQPDVWEIRLDVGDKTPEAAASNMLETIKSVQASIAA